mgnify:CR=1 FL=1
MNRIYHRQDFQKISMLTESTVYNFPDYYQEFQRYGIYFGITLSLMRDVISYVLNNKEKYSGTTEEKSKEILVDLEKDLDEIFYVTSLYQIPYTRTVAILEDIIQFTLENDNQYIY